MHWKQRRFRRTIPLDLLTNAPCFHSRAGNRILQAYEPTFVACDAFTKPLGETLLLPPTVMTDETDDSDVWEGDELINTASSTAPQEMNSPSETDPLGPCPIHTGSTHKWGQY